MEEGKNFLKFCFCSALGDQVRGEGPAAAPTLGRTDGGHLDLTILWWHREVVQRCLYFSCCKSLLQGEFLLCGSQRGGGEAWSDLEVQSLPKKAGGGPGRISVSSREGGAEALGLLNILSHPHPASAGIVHLHSSHIPKAPGRGPQAHAQHMPNPPDQSLCLFPGLFNLLPPCGNVVPILVHEDRAGSREGMCLHMVKNSV